jgi:hypothetical protein
MKVKKPKAVNIFFKHVVNDSKKDLFVEQYGVNGYYLYYKILEFFAIKKTDTIDLDDEKNRAEFEEYLLPIKNAIEIIKIVNKDSMLFEESFLSKNILKTKQVKVGTVISSEETYEESIRDKKRVADLVYLTEEEICKFKEIYCNIYGKNKGEDFVRRCVQKLNDYKSNDPLGRRRYYNDAAAIRSWVVNQVAREPQFYIQNFVQENKSQKPEATDLSGRY